MHHKAPTPSESKYNPDGYYHHDYAHFVRWMRHLQAILPDLKGERRTEIRVELAKTRQIVDGWSGPKRDHFFDWQRHLEENILSIDPDKQPERYREMAEELERTRAITAALTPVDLSS